MSFETYLLSLLTSSFVSSTLLPGGSEVLLLWGVNEYPESLWSIIMVATVGNTIGAMVTYGIGRWIPNRVESKTVDFFRRWGVWSLLFSWVPLIGDGFCLAAGWLRISCVLSITLIVIGKLARYAVLAYGYGIFFN